jgi:glyoxylase-like metal-dependent hydrolase (beta-lactamase superfamily II)
MTMTRALFHEPTSTLTYVVWDSHTRDAVVIDPVLDYDPLGSKTATTAVGEVTNFLRAEDLSLRHILETNTHGIRHLRLPVNLGQPTDEIGQPMRDPT